MHSDYTPITILLRLRNKIIELIDSHGSHALEKCSENRMSYDFRLAIGSTESAILKK